ncbi:hypothetical protein KIPB_003650 [Kipferlia bialata]|uniref:Uncharacterized protein n=1 Tax=Kipferlia bialata TaxID=797122 RepID=A0A9K3GH71_9EUKA|nr:hypothetical protein KIPB_003650 [Kipferlia bialata]|eukprot:g3650.t1
MDLEQEQEAFSSAKKEVTTSISDHMFEMANTPALGCYRLIIQSLPPWDMYALGLTCTDMREKVSLCEPSIARINGTDRQGLRAQCRLCRGAVEKTIPALAMPDRKRRATTTSKAKRSRVISKATSPHPSTSPVAPPPPRVYTSTVQVKNTRAPRGHGVPKASNTPSHSPSIPPPLPVPGHVSAAWVQHTWPDRPAHRGESVSSVESIALPPHRGGSGVSSKWHTTSCLALASLVEGRRVVSFYRRGEVDKERERETCTQGEAMGVEGETEGDSGPLSVVGVHMSLPPALTNVAEVTMLGPSVCVSSVGIAGRGEMGRGVLSGTVLTGCKSISGPVLPVSTRQLYAPVNDTAFGLYSISSPSRPIRTWDIQPIALHALSQHVTSDEPPVLAVCRESVYCLSPSCDPVLALTLPPDRVCVSSGVCMDTDSEGERGGYICALLTVSTSGVPRVTLSLSRVHTPSETCRLTPIGQGSSRASFGQHSVLVGSHWKSLTPDNIASVHTIPLPGCRFVSLVSVGNTTLCLSTCAYATNGDCTVPGMGSHAWLPISPVCPPAPLLAGSVYVPGRRQTAMWCSFTNRVVLLDHFTSTPLCLYMHPGGVGGILPGQVRSVGGTVGSSGSLNGGSASGVCRLFEFSGS